MRLYSNKEGVDSFAFETIEPMVNYTIPITEKVSNINLEFGAPYQLEDDEWEQYVTVVFNYKF